MKDIEVEDRILVCPYCMDPSEGKISCCGESSTHFENANLMIDGTILLDSELDELIDTIQDLNSQN